MLPLWRTGPLFQGLPAQDSPRGPGNGQPTAITAAKKRADVDCLVRPIDTPTPTQALTTPQEPPQEALPAPTLPPGYVAQAMIHHLRPPDRESTEDDESQWPVEIIRQVNGSEAKDVTLPIRNNTVDALADSGAFRSLLHEKTVRILYSKVNLILI